MRRAYEKILGVLLTAAAASLWLACTGDLAPNDTMNSAGGAGGSSAAATPGPAQGTVPGNNLGAPSLSGGGSLPGGNLSSGGGTFPGNPAIGKGVIKPARARKVQAVPALTSGTRLRARYYQTEDGIKLLTHWYDAQLQTECNFRQVSGSEWRCVPVTGGSPSYLDSECKTKVGLQFDNRFPVKYMTLQTGASAAVSSIPAADSSCAAPLFEVFAATPLSTPAKVYGNGSSGCGVAFQSPAWGPYRAPPPVFSLGAAVPLTTFALAHGEVSATPEGFPFVAFATDDGARFWVPQSDLACDQDTWIAAPGKELVIAGGRMQVTYKADTAPFGQYFEVQNDGQVQPPLPIVGQPDLVLKDRSIPCEPAPVGPNQFACAPRYEDCTYSPDSADSLGGTYADAGCGTQLEEQRDGVSSSLDATDQFCWEYGRQILHWLGTRPVFTGAEPAFERDYAPNAFPNKICQQIPATKYSYPTVGKTYVEVGGPIPVAGTFPPVAFVLE